MLSLVIKFIICRQPSDLDYLEATIHLRTACSYDINARLHPNIYHTHTNKHTHTHTHTHRQSKRNHIYLSMSSHMDTYLHVLYRSLLPIPLLQECLKYQITILFQFHVLLVVFMASFISLGLLFSTVSPTHPINHVLTTP